jgi:hypothetical protein
MEVTSVNTTAWTSEDVVSWMKNGCQFNDKVRSIKLDMMFDVDEIPEQTIDHSWLF